MGIKVRNNAYGTLVVGIAPGDTAITIGAGEGARFPTLISGDYFYGTLIDVDNNLEIVRVTARAVDTMVVVRAQDNTIARSYPSGSRFELRPTAAMFEDLTKAENTTYNPATSGIGEFNVQDALDNLDARLDSAETTLAVVPGNAEDYTDAQIAALAAGTAPAPKIRSAALQARIEADLGLYKRFGVTQYGGFITSAGAFDERLFLTPRAFAAFDAIAYHPSGWMAVRRGNNLRVYRGSVLMAEYGGYYNGGIAPQSVFIDNDLNIYAAKSSTTLAKVRLDGTTIWTVGLDGTFSSVTVSKDGTVFAGDRGGRVHRIDQTSGGTVAAVTWVRSGYFGPREIRGICLDPAGNVYISFDGGSAGANGGRVFKLDPTNGDEVWGAPVSSTGRGQGLAFGPDNVLVWALTGSPRIIRIDPDTGAEIWNRSISDGVITCAVRGDGIIMVGGTDSTIRVVSADNTFSGAVVTTSGDPRHVQCELGTYGHHWDETDPMA